MSYVNGSGPHVSLTHRSGSPLSGTQVSWTDFNDAQDQDDLADQLMAMHHLPESFTKDQIKEKILQYLDQALFYLFPKGETRRQQFLIGDIHGNEGESLKVERKGAKAGQWYDFATDDGGDIVDLWGAARGWKTRTQFPDILRDMQTWLGQSSIMESVCESLPPQKQRQVTDLGYYTGKWDYHDATGKLIACTYRYDTPKGKEFRPWDVKRQQHRFPDLRPLYNQPGLLHSDRVILVEGEKCAEALISVGMCATTAMGGANAPLEKTDWSPLAGKHVFVWPDNDAPGKNYGERLIFFLQQHSLLSLSLVHLPDDLPEKWDAADAVAEGRDIELFLQNNAKKVSFEGDHPPEGAQPLEESIPQEDHQGQDLCESPPYQFLNASGYLSDTSFLPDDLVSPRILTPGGLLVFGGAPKVGKTDFILSWMMHMAAGIPFMGMNAPKPLRVGYLQTEVEYDYMRERLQKVSFEENYLPLVGENLWITPKADITLDKEGVKTAAAIVRQTIGMPDVLVIDPLRNVFDGASENDNKAMIDFLRNRIDELRNLINPKAAIILIHHTRKLSKQEFASDPFYALSGASALRSFYTAGMILSRPDEKESLRQLTFELRYGEPIAMKHLDKIAGKWCEMDMSHERTVRDRYGKRCDGERRRLTDMILQLIVSEGKKGNLYSPGKFSDTFDSRYGLGGERSIYRRINVLASKGFIRFNKNQPNIKRKAGVMCVEDMMIPSDREETNPETGEIFRPLIPFLPTHYKYEKMVYLPVEDPNVWIYSDDEQS